MEVLSLHQDENNFVLSVYEQLLESNFVTDKQLVVLKEIIPNLEDDIEDCTLRRRNGG